MDDCIEWQKSKIGGGYGCASPRFGTRYAHRQVWIERNGPIPDGMVVMHTCDNRPCVNIDHLRLGTPADNNADRHEKGRDGAALGSKNGSSVLDEATVLMIRKMHEGGLRVARIAREVGCSWSAVDRVVKGRAWRHVA